VAARGWASWSAPPWCPQADHHPGLIGEFVGMGRDLVTGYPEPTLRFVIRNPVLPATARDGTREHPFALWPIAIEHISPAAPADLERPLSYRVDGEPSARAPGRPRVHMTDRHDAATGAGHTATCLVGACWSGRRGQDRGPRTSALVVSDRPDERTARRAFDRSITDWRASPQEGAT
jgi:hypothetical protein